MVKKFISLLIISISLGFLVTPLAYGVNQNNTICEGLKGKDYDNCIQEEKDKKTGTPSSVGDRTFLGLVPWNSGLEWGGSTSDYSEDSLKNDIWVIAANVATDIAIIAAYLILGYVIYGGYLYIFSSGDPGKVATAKKTLSQAFIGLAIVLSANLIMGTVRIALVGGRGNFANCATASGCVSADTMVTNLISWFISIAGIVSVIFLVYGGISYITSTGDPGKVQKAKNTIMYALIGLAIVALSATITAFVSSTIRDANNSAYINNTTISKEVYEININ